MFQNLGSGPGEVVQTVSTVQIQPSLVNSLADAFLTVLNGSLSCRLTTGLVHGTLQNIIYPFREGLPVLIDLLHGHIAHDGPLVALQRSLHQLHMSQNIIVFEIQ